MHLPVDMSAAPADASGGFATALRDAIAGKLQGAAADTIARFADELTGPLDEDTAGEVLRELLTAGVSVEQVTAALLLCQLHAAERLDARLRSGVRDGPGPFSIIDLVTVFARVQTLWMSVVHDHYDTLLGESEQALSRSNERLLIETTKALWLKDGVADLFNYFCELPVTASVRVHELDSAYLTVELTAALRQVLAASDHGATALAHASDPGKTIVLRRQGSDEHCVVFRIVGASDHHEARRRRVRIRPPRATPLTVILQDQSTFDGQVVDFSVIGMGVQLPAVEALPVGSKIECSALFEGRGRPYEFSCTGTVRWFACRDGSCRAGIELVPSQVQMQALERLMQEFQRDAIGRLGRKMGADDD